MTARRPTRQMVAPVAELSDGCREQLLTGHDFFGDGYGHDAESDPTAMERMRADWQRFRDELLQEWIASHPGSRPFAWWAFDAPARRETSDGSDHPFDRPERRALCAEWHAQYPAIRHDKRFVELFFGVPVICVESVRYETERQYLVRRGLLTTDELCKCTSTKETT